MIKKWTTDTWISLSAVIVSVCALFVAVNQGVVSRNHHKLSVKPHLIVFYSEHEEDGIGWSIRNSGLGPAQLRSIKKSIGDTEYSGWNEILKKHGIVGEYHYTNPSYNWIYKDGDENPLLRLPWGSTEGEQLRKNLRDTLKIEVCYCSFYEDCWTTSNINKVPQSISSCGDGS